MNAVDEHGNSPLHYAAASGAADLVRLPLARGAIATLVNKASQTPCDMANDEGHAKLADEPRRRWPSTRTKRSCSRPPRRRRRPPRRAGAATTPRRCSARGLRASTPCNASSVRAALRAEARGLEWDVSFCVECWLDGRGGALLSEAAGE